MGGPLFYCMQLDLAHLLYIWYKWLPINPHTHPVINDRFLIFHFYRTILTYIDSGDPYEWKGYAMSFTMFIVVLMGQFFLQRYLYHNYNFGIWCRTSVTAAVYRKVSVMTGVRYPQDNPTISEVVQEERERALCHYISMGLLMTHSFWHVQFCTILWWLHCYRVVSFKKIIISQR